MSETLHTKHRPRTFDEVVGHTTIVKSLRDVIKRHGSQTFLFCGPSGCGKTTLARIAARAAGCLDANITEVDAASRTGVDDMRAIQEMLRYKPMGEGSKRAVVLDECHSLSKNSWQSLLKITEEPPEHAFWFFCTTEPSKVPDTIKTRAISYTLKDISYDDLAKLYERVVKTERIGIAADVGDTIIKEAHGSPRQLLVNIELCRNARNRREANELLYTASQSDAMLELCRFLVKGGSWMKAMGLLDKLDGENPESVRIVVANYMASVAKGAKTDRAACHALGILDAFSQPFNQSDKLAPLITAIGRVLFTEG
jgi:DNA polymerase III gamma/tau subunit